MAKIYGGDIASGDRDTRFVLAEVCSQCYDEAIDSGMEESEIAATMDGNGEDRFSFGVYAGHYCDRHWKKAGYRDREDPSVRFDPMDAGEVMDEDDY